MKQYNRTHTHVNKQTICWKTIYTEYEVYKGVSSILLGSMSMGWSVEHLPLMTTVPQPVYNDTKIFHKWNIWSSEIKAINFTNQGEGYIHSFIH